MATINSWGTPNSITYTYTTNNTATSLKGISAQILNFEQDRYEKAIQRDRELEASPEEVEAEFGVEFGDIVILGLGDKIVEFILYNVVRAYETEEYFFQDSQGNSYGMDSWTLISENESDTLDS